MLQSVDRIPPESHSNPEYNQALSHLCEAVERAYGVPATITQISGHRHWLNYKFGRKPHIVQIKVPYYFTLMLAHNGDDLYLIYINLGRQPKGSGIGRSIVDTLIVVARELGYKTLSAMPDDYALRFWKRYTKNNHLLTAVDFHISVGD